MNSPAVVASPLRQPRAVWAVAFACVISFMGIGLVDPILPALATQLRASPSQVTLLSAGSSASAPAGGWATRCSSPPRSR